MRKKIIAAAAAAAAIVAVAAPASAITRGGELDDDKHPYVGLMIAEREVYAEVDGEDVLVGYEPLWRCSGALVSPTVYVTAGHCVSAPAARAELWFISDLEPDPSVHGYGVWDAPDPSDWFVGEAAGTVHPHPDYIDEAFFLYDLGVVVLDTPIIVDRYASIADLGTADGFTNGRNKDTSLVTAVGYGLQEIVEGPAGVGPDFDPKLQADKTRYTADLMVVNRKGVAGLGPINPDQAFLMSGDAKHGGTCFGDSGGPILVGGTDIIVGVNSFGLNSNCAGVGGAYRVDQPDDHQFLDGFGILD